MYNQVRQAAKQETRRSRACVDLARVNRERARRALSFRGRSLNALGAIPEFSSTGARIRSCFAGLDLTYTCM